MSCTNPNEEVNLTLEPWHSLESYFDSVTGRSPLIQLCRMCNRAYNAFTLADLVFPRIGSDTSDNSLGLIDYELNPDFNPYQDFYSILSQCHSMIAYLLGFEILGSDCNKRTLVNRDALFSFLSSLGVTTESIKLQEEWEPIIVGLRQILTDMSTAQFILSDWEESVLALVVGSTYPLKTGTHQRNDPAALFVRDFDGCIDYEIRFGGGYNKWSNRADNCGTGIVNLGGYPYGNVVGAFFDRNLTGPYSSEPVCSYPTIATVLTAPGGLYKAIRMGDGTTCYETSIGDTGLFCDQYFNLSFPCSGRYFLKSRGWVTFENSTWSYIIKREGVQRDVLDGETVTWTIENQGSNDVSATVTPSSGSFTWTAGVYEIEIEMSMSLNDIVFSSDQWTGSHFYSPSLVLSPATYNFCKDFCGVYHLQ